MVVLAASICTRGGKAVLSRQFREMSRSRVEALLASFPKLADSGMQHTTVEHDSVRFVYQPLDELYMVLITNKQSNILQDIDSLRLFAQMVASMCSSLDEREILRSAYELLSAFDEIITLGYRENLSISQIKTFLEMESHEERIQEIIARNKELEATEERKRKAKQLEMQRKESARARSGVPRAPPLYPASYNNPLVHSTTPSTLFDSYEAEKSRQTQRFSAPRGKGMQLGRKSKTSDMYEKVKGGMGMGAELDESPTLKAPASAIAGMAAPEAGNTALPGQDSVHVTVSELISAKMLRDGTLNALALSGDLSLRVTDPALTKIRLQLATNAVHGAQFRTHPNVDRALFNSSKVIQMGNAARGFPVNNPVGVLRWKASPKMNDPSVLPITFTVWVNQGTGDKCSVTVEYELTGGDALTDVTVSIPYAGSEPSVSTAEAVYEVSGDGIVWNVGAVDVDNSTGSIEFEGQAGDENDFFPMQVGFNKTTPFVAVEVSSASQLEDGEEVRFSLDSRSKADSYLIE